MVSIFLAYFHLWVNYSFKHLKDGDIFSKFSGKQTLKYISTKKHQNDGLFNVTIKKTASTTLPSASLSYSKHTDIFHAT